MIKMHQHCLSVDHGRNVDANEAALDWVESKLAIAYREHYQITGAK